jgi:hypothetical protein
MEYSPGAVATLSRKIPRTIRLLREIDSAPDEIGYPFRSLCDYPCDHTLCAQSRACDLRILHVGGERIALSRYAANATLREIRVAIGESALGHKHDLAVRRKMERGHETAHP